jgi:hypothetical protein
MKYSVRSLCLLVTVVAVLMALGVPFANLVRRAQRVALSMSAQSPLNQLSVALQNYHLTYGSLPPAVVTDSNGKAMHSWRVLILPFIEEGNALYQRYDFSEPWNSINNSKLLDQMPRIFHSPSERPSSKFTNMVAIAGQGTAFPSDKSVRYDEMKDGLENTALLTEITLSTIPWTQPVDLDVSAWADQQPKDGQKRNGVLQIGAVPWRCPYIVFADGIHCYSIRQNTKPSELYPATTIGGNERVTRAMMIESGILTRGCVSIDR